MATLADDDPNDDGARYREGFVKPGDSNNKEERDMEQGLTVKPAAPVVATSWEQMTDVIRKMYPKATDSHLAVFFYQCKRMGLDPLARQAHLVMRLNRKTGEWDAAIQTGIDGYRAVADRTGVYAGNDEPVFDEGLTQYQMLAANRAIPKTATVTVYKIVGGVRCAFTATAAWNAYAPQGDGAFMWTKMPFLMLGKCAEALAFRKAFPQDLSGVYTDEEMHQADNGNGNGAKPEPAALTAPVVAKVEVERDGAFVPTGTSIVVPPDTAEAPPAPPRREITIKEPNAPMTDAQHGAIVKLCGKLGITPDAAIEGAGIANDHDLTKGDASKVIGFLNAKAGAR